MRFTDISAFTIAVWALQLGNTLAADRGSYKVKAYVDDLCQKYTGFWSGSTARDCTNFDGLRKIKSIDVQGDNIGATCGFYVFASEGEDCKGEEWPLQRDICLRSGVGDLDSIKSFRVAETPCV